MFKKIFFISTVLVITLIAGVGTFSPLTARAAVVNRESIRAEIRSLVTELRILRDRLDALLARLLNGTGSELDRIQATQAVQQTQNLFHTISSGLRDGDSGEDILALQQFLNSSPDTRISDSGANSPGKETGVYDAATADAVIRFQEKYNVAAVFMILNEMKKASSSLAATTTTASTDWHLLASLGSLFSFNNLFPKAQAQAGLGSPFIHTMSGSLCTRPTLGSNGLGNSAGQQVACFQPASGEDKCKKVLAVGPVMVSCRFSSGQSFGSGPGTINFKVNNAVVLLCDPSCPGNADSVVMNAELGSPINNIPGSGMGPGGGLGTGSGNPMANFLQQIMQSVAKKLMGKKLASSQLGQFLIQGISSIASLQSACGQNGQAVSQSQAGPGSVFTLTGDNNLGVSVGGAAAGRRAGIAGVCYNQGCTTMLGVDPLTGSIGLRSTPKGAQFFNNVNFNMNF